MDSREAKVQKLKEFLEPNGKQPLKYLLVLDDVWSEDSAPWDGFLDSLRGISSAKGSWILVTTRNTQVAAITEIHSSPCSLEKLSDDNCRFILEKKAFGARGAPDDLKELGLELAKKCQGLPLAAGVLGGMLRNKGRDVWHSILDTGFQNIGGDGDGYINKILRLSFDHLPHPSLKKCFAYCSIFPQDFEMERNQLIQLWAAEGFLHSNPRNNMCMEEVGNMYFTILLDCNLFQDPEKDDYGNVLSCKMHDLVHDMVQLISESKTLRLKESTEAYFHGKTFRYLAVERSDGEQKPPFPLNESFKFVTTLFLMENGSINDGLISLIGELTCLRVLNLASSDAEELPESIGKLSHLRYLDLSDTPIETLPNSLCVLYNLQTLRVRDCKSLAKFPKNFKNLVNLRHFDFFPKDESSDLMPLEIGHLRSLQTLPFFNIGKEMGRQIEQLGSLNQLNGSLEIRNLELVRSMEEAKSAKLFQKPNIDELRLLWNALDNQRENDSECNQVLEGLHPHQNLKGLIIEGFFGDQLSTWILELKKLVKFELRNCKNCKELPPLGHMPFLKFLHLEGLDSLTTIWPYGRSTVERGDLFPALEYLILKDMLNLTELGLHCGEMVVSPRLKELEVSFCPSLKSISIPSGHQNLNALGKLRILMCSRLTHLQIFQSEWDSGSPPPPPPPPPPLQELEIWGCPNLISFPIDLTHRPPLSLLNIPYCKKLSDLPKGKLCSLTSLRELAIGPFSRATELQSFLDLFDAVQPPPHPYLPSLSRLSLYGWSHWESLPHQLQHLSALRYLELHGFGVKSLPDWFSKLSSLERLSLYNCKKLENLPSLQSMYYLAVARLRELQIEICPLLTERCNPESSSSTTDPNSERTKIIHYIQGLIINGQRIKG